MYWKWLFCIPSKGALWYLCPYLRITHKDFAWTKTSKVDPQNLQSGSSWFKTLTNLSKPAPLNRLSRSPLKWRIKGDSLLK